MGHVRDASCRKKSQRKVSTPRERETHRCAQLHELLVARLGPCPEVGGLFRQAGGSTGGLRGLGRQRQARGDTKRLGETGYIKAARHMRGDVVNWFMPALTGN